MRTVTEKSNFMRKVFGDFKLSRNGIDIAVRCPNKQCQSRDKRDKRKLAINLESNVYHCWVCGIKGKSVSYLLRKYCDPKFLQEYIDKFTDDILVEDEDIIDDKLSLPQDFIPIVMNLNSRDPDIIDTIRYLRSRDITDRDMWYFKMCYSNSGKFRRRVIMPSFDHNGELNYFVSRAIDDNARVKYVNSDIDKSSIIFNEINIDWNSELTLVEGPFDLLKCDDNSTCLLGSSLPQSSLLMRKIVENSTDVILGLDDDASKKSDIIARSLSDYGIHVRILPLMRKHDVGEMTKDDFMISKSSSPEWSKRDAMMRRIMSIGGSVII